MSLLTLRFSLRTYTSSRPLFKKLVHRLLRSVPFSKTFQKVYMSLEYQRKPKQKEKYRKDALSQDISVIDVQNFPLVPEIKF